MTLSSLLVELKRRNLYRAAAAYVAAGWALVEVADTLLPLFGFGELAMRNLVIALAVGFVPAMIAAWSFELTPEGLKRESEVAAGSALEARTNRMINRLIMLLLAIGLAFFAYDKFVLDPARDAQKISAAREQGKSEGRLEPFGDRSIVVLPFENLSADPEQEYLSDGLAEELLNLLQKIPELRVIARGSAFAFKGQGLALADIAKELKVAHVLEGSVRRSGNRLRITARLVDPQTMTQLWSEIYDREIADVFAIQDDIAGRVARELHVLLAGDGPRRRRVDPEAYLKFLQARHELNEGRYFESYRAILEQFEAAIALDPTLLEGWIGISRLNFLVYMHLPHPQAPSDWPAEDVAFRRAREALDRAAQIDPKSAQVIGFRAFGRAVADNDYAGAAADLERAVRLEPGNSDILLWTSYYARTIRRPEIAVRLIERELELDPRCPDCGWRMDGALFDAGRFDDARSEILEQRAASGRPAHRWYTLGRVELMRGDAQAALENFDLASDNEEGQLLRLVGRAMALYKLGRREEALAASAEFERRVPRDRTDMGQHRAELYAQTGRPERAVEVMARLLPLLKQGAQRGIAAASPLLRPLDELPQWHALLREYSIAPEDLRRIKFEISLPALDSTVEPTRTNDVT